MKTKFVFSILLLAFLQTQLFSQTILQGKVTDAETGEQIIFGTVALYQNDKLVTGTETDFDGYFSLTEIEEGEYNVVFSYTGYADYKVTGVIVEKEKTTSLNAKMSAGVIFDSCYPPCIWEPPLISRDETTQGFKFRSDEIRRIAF